VGIRHVSFAKSFPKSLRGLKLIPKRLAVSAAPMAAMKRVLCVAIMIQPEFISAESVCDGGACQAFPEDDSAVLLQTKEARALLDAQGLPAGKGSCEAEDSADAAGGMRAALKPPAWLSNMFTYPDAGPSPPAADPAFDPMNFCPLMNNAARFDAAKAVGGSVRVAAQKFIEYNAYVMSKGKAPVNPSTAKGITNSGPYGPFGMSWAKMRQMGLTFVLLPTLIATDGANRTEWFMQAAETSCWNPVPLAEGPMIFTYKDVAGDVGDYNQKRGYYTATAPQTEDWFIKEVPLFIDGAEHEGCRKLLQSVGFARDGDINIGRIEEVAKWKGCKPPSQSKVTDAVAPIVMEFIWGGLPTGKAKKAMNLYGQFGAFTIFGKYMYDVLKPLGIAQQISTAIEQVTDWAEGTEFAKTLEKAQRADLGAPWHLPQRKLVKVIVTTTMFAGMIGTADMTTKCVKYQMRDPTHVTLFKQDPEKYLIELMRFDSAVTSFTKVLSKDVNMTLEGRDLTLAAGTSVQDTLATSNRDPTHWSEPDAFNPNRKNLGDVLSWNGRASDVEAMDLKKAPRYCPGYCLSLKVGAAVCARMMGSYDELKAAGKILANNGEVQCNNFGKHDEPKIWKP